MSKKEITNQDLAKSINILAKSLDDLAISVKNGFDSVDRRLKALEQGHKDIKLKLTNVAYRFELEELERRVAKLENKL